MLRRSVPNRVSASAHRRLRAGNSPPRQQRGLLPVAVPPVFLSNRAPKNRKVWLDHQKHVGLLLGYLPKSSLPIQPITFARPLPPREHSLSVPTTLHGRSNIRSTSISKPNAISWNAASQNSSSSDASQLASKRRPETTVPSLLSRPSSYGCDKCPHYLVPPGSRTI
jgi:hypothetical protein